MLSSKNFVEKTKIILLFLQLFCQEYLFVFILFWVKFSSITLWYIYNTSETIIIVCILIIKLPSALSAIFVLFQSSLFLWWTNYNFINFCSFLIILLILFSFYLFILIFMMFHKHQTIWIFEKVIMMLMSWQIKLDNHYHRCTLSYNQKSHDNCCFQGNFNLNFKLNCIALHQSNIIKRKRILILRI